MVYQDLNDYEILSYIEENDEEAKNIMIKKYEPLIISIANKMISYAPNAGLELSDLIQEGMIGFDHAMEYFNEKKSVKFYTYAKTCIERSMISFIVASKRLKHKALNDSLSYDNTDMEDTSFEYLLKDNRHNPEMIVIHDLEEENLMNLIRNKLTDFETQVFELMLSSFTYREIAKILDKDRKQVDNAIQRIKAKAKVELEKQG